LARFFALVGMIGQLKLGFWSFCLSRRTPQNSQSG